MDGLEPLQSYLDVEKGKIKDPALAVLVTELAKNDNGLCIITTRETILDIRRFPSSVLQQNLEQISDEAGRALLRVRGIRGTDAELEAVTRAFGNHELAINLLAEYLHLIPGHPCHKAHDIPDMDIPEEQGKHLRRVIEAFATHFGEGAELEFLHLLGLFDRPADRATIDAVIQGKPIPGLTEHLQRLSKDGWSDLLERLRTTKLLARKSEHRPNTIDCHPLIREHFRQKLRENAPGAWRTAHGRLYEYFKNLPEKELPDTLEEMEPLLAHGCRAGRYNKTWEEVYQPKINRAAEAYCEHKLGAFSSHLATLSNLFEKVWSKPAAEFSNSRKGAALNYAGYGLRALGRLREAAQPMQVSTKNAASREDWKNAAIAAGNLSELYLTLGDVAQAVAFSRQSVEFADKNGDGFQKWVKRENLADALHQAGKFNKSEKIFQESENFLKKSGSNAPYLFPVPGFFYCDLLLSQGKYEETLKRTKKTLEYGKTFYSLLTFALDKLSLGRAYLFQALISPRSPFKAGILRG